MNIDENIKIAVEKLKNDGVIVYPTDTIYGLGCDVFSKKAVAKIYQIKRRDPQKPFSIICSDLKHISEYAIVPDYAFKMMKRLLPGPYTFILKASRNTPEAVVYKNKTVGIRIPDNKISLELVKELGHPIVTTSLNISGEKVMTNPNQLDKETANMIDCVINVGELGDMASTIIDVSGEVPVVVRMGKGKI